VTEAATGGSEIARNIQGVAVAAESTARGATDNQKAATELSSMAEDLQRLVNRFQYKTPNPQSPEVKREPVASHTP
jgi:methyl-accepting chemotaxis protein